VAAEQTSTNIQKWTVLLLGKPPLTKTINSLLMIKTVSLSNPLQVIGWLNANFTLSM
jgi:hypothetical protein